MIEGRKTYFIRAREARPHHRYSGEIVFHNERLAVQPRHYTAALLAAESAAIGI